jgi:ATP-binding cassette subfamily B (MDR/TAP) protein 1
VTRKDMTWFDTKMGAEGSVQATEGDQGPVGAGGMMTKFTRYVNAFYSYYCFTHSFLSEKLTMFAWRPLLHPECLYNI